MQKNKYIPIAILSILALAVLISLPVIAQTNNKRMGNGSQSQISQNQGQDKKTNSTSASSTLSVEQQNQLLYMIEEEKLAHDVYVKMYAIWGDSEFSNIAKSEVNHQEKILKLLNTYGITDPRSSTEGVFVNTDLQNLYNQLIASGSVNQQSAYDVGILIEQTDIKDLDTAISKFSQNDVTKVLSNLQKASENHLRAFTNAKS